jgi:hypothetical protein
MNKYDSVMARMQDHYNEALESFKESHIVGLWLQGSQNYELDLPTSDVDTKLIVTPTFKDIALAAKPVSTTHIRENNEHIDFKDIRLYIEVFKKQNLNFLEILFTPYFIINPLYYEEWNKLVIHREQIARMNPYRAVKSMKGIALEKYHAMEHEYPSKLAVIAKYGYDGKQVSHLLRVEDYLERYIAGEDYEKCLIPTLSKKNRLLDYKEQLIPLDEARKEAQKTLEHISNIADHFCNTTENKESSKMRELLEDVSYNIMRISVTEELKECIVR